ncbi:hypothetical protein BU23DRAFT_595544 [Bimuria novae-zelandiae CBS 107.79]|uniref:Uncharacterized protein n=1 Tax=Bimuria novae-zelandiae CBS 107.79 TaxID=1447943 RepID=A0A6A5VNL7_9PLEO|nr:hypothetical protein BU23DRAFT_595544 [Bimuria novae-zelandiae CBS 107.79]
MGVSNSGVPMGMGGGGETLKCTMMGAVRWGSTDKRKSESWTFPGSEKRIERATWVCCGPPEILLQPIYLRRDGKGRFKNNDVQVHRRPRFCKSLEDIKTWQAVTRFKKNEPSKMTPSGMGSFVLLRKLKQHDRMRSVLFQKKNKVLDDGRSVLPWNPTD